MRTYSSCVPEPLPDVKQQSLNHAHVVSSPIEGFLIIFLPSCLVLGGVLYKKYRAYRTGVLSNQIETLEKLWRISPKQ